MKLAVLLHIMAGETSEGGANIFSQKLNEKFEK